MLIRLNAPQFVNAEVMRATGLTMATIRPGSIADSSRQHRRRTPATVGGGSTP